MRPAHKSLAKSLGYCLTLGTAEAWAGFSALAAARLTDTERAALAFFALDALTPDQVERAAAASLRSMGMPCPPFLGGMDEARFWAAEATRMELKAYALAAFDALCAADQSAFIQHITRKEVAA